MRLKKTSPGKNLPDSQRVKRLKGAYIEYITRGQHVVQKWPRKRPEPPTAAQAEQRAEFTRMVAAVKDQDAAEIANAYDIARNSKYTWRDVSVLFMVGRMVELPNYGDFVAQYSLDTLGTEPGMIIIRTTEEWIALPISSDGKVLTAVNGLPAWNNLNLDQFGDAEGMLLIRTATGWEGLPIGDPDQILSIVAGQPVWAALNLDPFGSDEGTILFRDNSEWQGLPIGADDQVLTASGGLPEWKDVPYPPPPTQVEIVPGWVSGRYYGPPGNAGTVTITANRLYYLLVPTPSAVTITRTGFYVQVQVASSEVTMGIYENNGGRPGNRLGIAGAISTATNGAKTFTGLSVPITGGWVWLALVGNGAINVAGIPQQNLIQSPWMGVSAPATNNTNPTNWYESYTYSSGNLPSSAGSLTDLNGTAPMQWVGK